MRVVVGPVPSAAARSWTEHVLHNLDVVSRHRSVLPFRLPDEVIDEFRALLGAWHAVALAHPIFLWSEDLDDEKLERLLRYWANLDALSDEQVRTLGLDWSPAEARPFFEAVAVAVATATEADDAAPHAFARFLVRNGSKPARSVYGPGVADPPAGPAGPAGTS